MQEAQGFPNFPQKIRKPLQVKSSESKVLRVNTNAITSDFTDFINFRLARLARVLY